MRLFTTIIAAFALLCAVKVDARFRARRNRNAQGDDRDCVCVCEESCLDDLEVQCPPTASPTSSPDAFVEEDDTPATDDNVDCQLECTDYGEDRCACEAFCECITSLSPNDDDAIDGDELCPGDYTCPGPDDLEDLPCESGVSPSPTPRPTSAPFGFPTFPAPTSAPSPTSSTNICFSGSNTVTVQDRGIVLMKDLQVGDMVVVDSQRHTYEPVYSFGHYDQNCLAAFLKISTKDSPEPLELSAGHLIFVPSKAETTQAVRADSIQKGDVLLVHNGKPSNVTNISHVQKKGMYMPLTSSGRIVVSGIHASTYVSLIDYAPTMMQYKSYYWITSEQTIFHWWMSPVRIMCMGVSSTFCTTEKNLVLAREGIMGWIQFGRWLAQVVERQSFWVQVFVLGPPVVSIGVTLHSLECLLGGPSLAPTMMVFLAFTGYIFMNRIKSKRKMA